MSHEIQRLNYDYGFISFNNTSKNIMYIYTYTVAYEIIRIQDTE